MKLKERLGRGEHLLGTMITTFEHPDLIKILQNCGYDFAIIDCEHGSYSYETVSRMIGVARAIGFPILVRIPEIRREPVLKFMEMGASGLLLPNAESAEQARTLVSYAKYAPMGQRGVSLTRPHTDFKKVNGREYMAKVNSETILMCQIESAKGVENVESILAVDGIDVAFVGPNDMSQDYGILGEFDDPTMVSAFERILAAAKAAGKAAGVHFGSQDQVAKWAKAGYQMNMCGSDVSALTSGAKASIQYITERSK